MKKKSKNCNLRRNFLKKQFLDVLNKKLKNAEKQREVDLVDSGKSTLTGGENEV